MNNPQTTSTAFIPPYSLSLSNIPKINNNRHNIQKGYQSIINNTLPMLLEHQILMLISILIIVNMQSIK
jgi:hypothetical protein